MDINDFIGTQMKTIEIGIKSLLEITDAHLYGLAEAMEFVPSPDDGWGTSILAFENTLEQGNAWIRYTALNKNNGRRQIVREFKADFNLFTYAYKTIGDGTSITKTGSIGIKGLNYLIEQGYSLPLSTFKQF